MTRIRAITGKPLNFVVRLEERCRRLDDATNREGLPILARVDGHILPVNDSEVVYVPADQGHE